MHNPTDAELEDLQAAAVARGDDALAAFDVYINALNIYSEAVDDDKVLLPYEAAVASTRATLDKLLVMQ